MGKTKETAAVSNAIQPAEQTAALVSEVVTVTTIGVVEGDNSGEAITAAKVETPEVISLFERIQAVVKKCYSYESKEVVSTVQFKNKQVPTEVLTQAEFLEACLAGKNAGDYEPVVVTINPKAELKALIFNDYEPKSAAQVSKYLSEFSKACEIATGFKLSDQTKPLTTSNDKPVEAPAKKEKTDFQKSVNAANAKITKAKAELKEATEKKKAEKEEALKKARLERVQLYIREGKTPKASFKDLELYLSEKAKTVGTVE